MLQLLLKLQLHTTPRFSSLTLPAETEKVSFQPPIQEWQAWLNNAMKFCSQSNTFYWQQIYFLRSLNLCNPSLSFHRLLFTLHSLLLFWLLSQIQVQHMLRPARHQLVTAQQKDGSCIFNRRPLSSTPHSRTLSCQVNSKETQCNEAVNWGSSELWPFVWLEYRGSTDSTRHLYSHPILVLVP